MPGKLKFFGNNYVFVFLGYLCFYSNINNDENKISFLSAKIVVGGS